MGYGTEDRDPQSARHLVGIAELGVDPIKHHRPAQPQRQAGGESQENDAGRRVPHRILRHDRVIEDARVRYGTLLRETRLVVVLLQTGEEVLRQRHLPLQPGLVDSAGRHGLYAPRILRHATPQLGVSPRELGHQLARQGRDRLPLERGHLGQAPLHQWVGIVVLVAQRPQLRLLRGQLVECLLQLHVLLHRPDDRQGFRRHTRVTRLREHPLERVTVLLHLLAVNLHREVILERWIVGAGASRGDARAARAPRRGGRERDRLHLKPLERLLGVEQVLVRGRQLLVQNLRQLGEFLAAQVRGDLHEPFGDPVDRGGNARGVFALQMHPQEVARGIRGDLEILTERARRVAHGRHGELDGAAGGDRAGGRCPGEAQTCADGISHRAVLHLDALVRRQRKGLAVAIHGEAIHARSILLRHAERLEQGRVLARLGRQEQTLVAHDLVEHAIGLEEIEPRLGLERLPGANRAALLSAALVGLVDPQRRLHHVLGLDEPGGRQAADRAHDGHHRDQPLETRDGTQHAAPVDAGLRLGESLAESHVGARGQGGRRGHGGHRRAGVQR